MCRHFGTSVFPHYRATLPHYLIRPGPSYLSQHPHDVFFDGADVCFDLFELPWWNVFIKAAVEVDFIADDANLIVFLIAFRDVSPGVAGRSKAGSRPGICRV